MVACSRAPASSLSLSPTSPPATWLSPPSLSPPTTSPPTFASPAPRPLRPSLLAPRATAFFDDAVRATRAAW
jgi:hypothetical protein